MKPICKSLFMLSCLFLVFIVLAFPLQAQTTSNAAAWTLEECLKKARLNNIQIKQAALQTKSAQANYSQSKAARMPDLNGNASYSLNFGRNVDPTTYEFNNQASQNVQLSLNSNVILYNGNRLKNTISQRELEYQLAQLQVENIDNNLSLNVFSAYLQILLAQEQLKVLQNQTQLTQQQLDQTQKLIKAGARPKGDLFEIEAQIANDKLSMVNAQNAIKTAYLGLAQVLDYYEPIAVVRPTIRVPDEDALSDLTAATVYQEALSSQPQIKTAAMRSRISEQGLRIAESGKKLTVSMGASLSSGYSSLAKRVIEAGDEILVLPSPYITSSGELVNYVGTAFPSYENAGVGYQLNSNFGGALRLNVNIPIYNKEQVKNAITQSSIGLENQRLTEQLEKNNLRRTVEQAFLDAKAAAENYNATQVAVSAQEQALEFTKKRLEAGAGTTFEYLTNKNRLAVAELNLQSAEFNYYFRVKILEFYRGQRLSFD